MKLRLASASPRRRELVKYLDMPVEILPVDSAEIAFSADPCIAACEISAEKARASVAARSIEAGEVVIGADTTVCVGTTILGKPRNREDAERMISMISGRAHDVITGVTLCYLGIQGNVCERSFYEVTHVYVNNISKEEIDAYLDLGEYKDKAGAYAIQGIFSRHIAKIDGDYNNVVGFPVTAIFEELKKIISEI